MPSRKSSKPTLSRLLLEHLMFGAGAVRRFTQDSPVLPDVWLAYAGLSVDDAPALTATAARAKAFPPMRLLVTPYRETSAGEVRMALAKCLGDERTSSVWKKFGHADKPLPRLAYNQTTVAAELYFEDLIRVVLPMTSWWKDVDGEVWAALGNKRLEKYWAKAINDPEHPAPIPAPANAPSAKPIRPPASLLWMMRVVGVLALFYRGKPLPRGMSMERGVSKEASWLPVLQAFVEIIAKMSAGKDKPKIYSISRNRTASATIARSTLAVKADAARRLFDISCQRLAWAVIDSGIDATHPAFRKRSGKDAAARPFHNAAGAAENQSRIVKTYDFTQIESLLDPDSTATPDHLMNRLEKQDSTVELTGHIDDLQRNLQNGKTIDWKSIAPLLEVPHLEESYIPPSMDHGTHVAGILAADWKTDDPGSSLSENLVGVCPDLRLYDLRVLNAEGQGDEFSVMAALQFVRYLNSTNDYVVVHGVNLSLSIPHDIANYACGRTPVCDEAERVVNSGTVVVAAAGNQGYRKYAMDDGSTAEAYNSASITDPGNADLVITVGATHRYKPHTYGVSYFSSRGPTGDGRRKPDLVAPGEKITAPLPEETFGLKDGTSMAAPHVSGAAALLMARHNELVGQAQRIKEILCTTATDLGRERYFQGAGMLDVLRALQSI